MVNIRGCLQFVIVVFPDHTHLLFLVFGQNGDTQLLKYFLSDIKDGYNFELFQITSP